MTKRLEIAKVKKLTRFDKKLLERGAKIDTCPDCKHVEVLVPVIYGGHAAQDICCDCFVNGEQMTADDNKYLWYALYRRRSCDFDNHLVLVKRVLNDAKITPIN